MSKENKVVINQGYPYLQMSLKRVLERLGINDASKTTWEKIKEDREAKTITIKFKEQTKK